MTGLKGLAVLGAVIIAALLLITMVVSVEHSVSAAEDVLVTDQVFLELGHGRRRR